MIEQPVGIGLVVVLGGGRLAKSRPDRRAGSEHAVEELAKLRILDRCQQLPELLLELLDGGLGAVGELVVGDLAGSGRPDLIDLDLRSVLLVNGEPPGDVGDLARLRGDERRLDVVPDDRRDAAGAVAEHQAQVLASLPGRAAIPLADHEGGGDGLPIGQLAHADAAGPRGGIDPITGNAGDSRLVAESCLVVHIFAHPRERPGRRSPLPRGRPCRREPDTKRTRRDRDRASRASSRFAFREPASAARARSSARGRSRSPAPARARARR